MTTNIILVIGIMIAAGFLGGVIASKFKFPRITGYLIVGILLSPSAFNIVPEDIVESLGVITSIALGIVAYLIGASLRLDSMGGLGKSIAWITPLQSVAPWLITTMVLTLLAPFILSIPEATLSNTYFPMAFVIGAIASATAPAATIAIIREYKAKGPLTTTLLTVVAFDDLIAIVAFAFAAGIAQTLVGSSEGAFIFQTLANPLFDIIISAVIGTVFGFVAIFVAKIVRTRSLMLVVVFGTILLVIGVAELLGVSALLANMVVGLVVVNKSDRNDMLLAIEEIEHLVFAVFFVLAGMHFDLGVIKIAGILGVLIILARCSGKYFGVRAGARISGAPEAVGKYLGFALLPKAGVTIGLGLMIEPIFPDIGSLMFNALLASTIINELFAPPLAKYAINKAGEANA